MPLSPLAAGYDNLLLDLDGCVWVGDEVTPGAPEAIAALRAADKRIQFITNDGRHTVEQFVRKLWRLGIQAGAHEVVSSGAAMQHVLAERFSGERAVVIGAPAIHRHVLDAGLRVATELEHAGRAGVVVVSGHSSFDFAALHAATRALASGAALLATDGDANFPLVDGPCPGTGAIVAAIEKAAGARAEVIGKPGRLMFATALDRLPPGRSLVVGDRLDADIAGARAAGLDGALVLSGSSPAADERCVAVAPTLSALVLGG